MLELIANALRVQTLATLGSAAIAVALWFGLWVLVRAATRPRPVTPAANTGELRPESPAVVSLLVGLWRRGDGAVAATLLDLAARGLVTLRGATVGVGESDHGQLAGYERRLLERVKSVAADGHAPVAALGFRSRAEAAVWHRRFHADVLVEARRRGLSARRFGIGAMTILGIAGIALGAGLAAFAAAHTPPGLPERVQAAIALGLVLGAVGMGYPGERDTPDGRAAAAHWLGVRAWLHRQPADTVHCGQYVPYAAATGVLPPDALRRLRLRATGNRLIWSNHGGGWRQVRVRYPRLWSRYGRPPRALIWPALVLVTSGVVLIVFHNGPRDWLARIDTRLAPADVFDIAEPVALAVGVFMAALGAYQFARAAADHARRRTVTGQVLAVREWRMARGRFPDLWHVAVDEGTSDDALAWVVPRQRASALRNGDLVRFSGYPWTRAVDGLEVIAGGRQADDLSQINMDEHLARHAGDRTAAKADRAAERMATTAAWVAGEAHTRGPQWAMSLLSLDEAARILDTDVSGWVARTWTVTYYTRKNRTAATMFAVRSTGRLMAWMYRRGTPLPGVGDEAYLQRRLGMVRVGTAMVAFTVYGVSKQYAARTLTEVLTLVASRMG